MNAFNRIGVVALSVLFLLTPLHGWTLFSVRGLPLARIDLLAVALVFIAIVATVVIRGGMRFVRVNIITLALLLSAIVSSAFAILLGPTPMEPIGTLLVQIVILFLLFVTVPNLVTTTEGLVIVVRAWLLGAVGSVAFGIYQGLARVLSLPFAVLVFNTPEPGTVQRAGYTASFGAPFRVASIFPEPAWFGTYLVPPAVFCLTIFIHRPEQVIFQRDRTSGACAIILLFGIAISASLLAYVTLLATIAGFIIPIGLLHGRIQSHQLTGAAFAVALPILLFKSLREAFQRLLRLVMEMIGLLLVGDSRIAVGSAQRRFDIATRIIESWANGSARILFFGEGPNGLVRNGAIEFTSASSGYLQMLYDTGFLGMTLFVALIVAIGVMTYRHGTMHADGTHVIGLAFTSSVIATFVQFLQIGYIFPVRWLGVIGALCYLGVTRLERSG